MREATAFVYEICARKAKNPDMKIALNAVRTRKNRGATAKKSIVIEERFVKS